MPSKLKNQPLSPYPRQYTDSFYPRDPKQRTTEGTVVYYLEQHKTTPSDRVQPKQPHLSPTSFPPHVSRPSSTVRPFNISRNSTNAVRLYRHREQTTKQVELSSSPRRPPCLTSPPPKTKNKKRKQVKEIKGPKSGVINPGSQDRKETDQESPHGSVNDGKSKKEKKKEDTTSSPTQTNRSRKIVPTRKQAEYY